MRDGNEALDGVDTAVPRQRRLAIYFEESLRSGWDPAILMQWLLADPSATGESPQVCVEELISAVVRWLRENGRLPRGLWSLAAELDASKLFERLGDAELASLLAGRDPEDVGGSELAQIVSPTAGSIDRSLQRFLRRVQSRDLDPAAPSRPRRPGAREFNGFGRHRGVAAGTRRREARRRPVDAV